MATRASYIQSHAQTQDLGNGIIYTPKQTITLPRALWGAKGTGDYVNLPESYSINGVKYTNSGGTYTYSDGTQVNLNVPSGQSAFVSSDGSSFFTASPGQAPSQGIQNVPADPNVVAMYGNAGVDVTGNQTYSAIMNAQNAGQLGISSDGSSLINTSTGQTIVSGLQPYPGYQDAYQFSFQNPYSEGSISAVIAADPKTGKVGTINPAQQMSYAPGQPGGFFTPLLESILPMAGIIAPFIPGLGIGVQIADALGLADVLTSLGIDASFAPQVGNAIASIGKQVATGTPLDQAITNAALSTVIQTGSTDLAKGINSVVNSPGISNAIGSAISAAGTTAATGGNSEQAFTNALLSSGISGIQSATAGANAASTTTTTPAASAATPPSNVVAAADTGTTTDVTAPTTGAIAQPQLIQTMYVDSNGNPIMTDSAVETASSHYYLKDGTPIFRNPDTSYTASAFITGSGQPIESYLNLVIGGDTANAAPVSTPQPTIETPTPSTVDVTTPPAAANVTIAAPDTTTTNVAATPGYTANISSVSIPATSTSALSTGLGTNLSIVPSVPSVTGTTGGGASNTGNIAPNTGVGTSNTGASGDTSGGISGSYTTASTGGGGGTPTTSDQTLYGSYSTTPTSDTGISGSYLTTPTSNVTTITAPQTTTNVASQQTEGEVPAGNAVSNVSTYTPDLVTILLGGTGAQYPSATSAPTTTTASPGSAALAQALRLGDPFEHEEGKKKNVWNIESLRYMGDSGAS